MSRGAPLLPIKSYAAVEPELMKEIEKLRSCSPNTLPSIASHQPFVQFRISAHWFFFLPNVNRTLSLVSSFPILTY